MSWSAWRLDTFTWGWIAWLLFFLVWETLGIINSSEHTLTEHLRPLFISQSLTWFLASGLWLWLGYHFLLEEGHPF